MSKLKEEAENAAITLALVALIALGVFVFG